MMYPRMTRTLGPGFYNVYRFPTAYIIGNCHGTRQLAHERRHSERQTIYRIRVKEKLLLRLSHQLNEDAHDGSHEEGSPR